MLSVSSFGSAAPLPHPYWRQTDGDAEGHSYRSSRATVRRSATRPPLTFVLARTEFPTAWQIRTSNAAFQKK